MGKKTVESSIVFSILALGHKLSKERDSYGREAGVTSQQWLILLILDIDPNATFGLAGRGKEGLFASELASLLNVSRPNITNLINVLVQKKLVVQREDQTDRRKKKLVLSEKGRSVLQKLEPQQLIGQEKFLSCLSFEEKNEFLSLLEKCIKGK